MPKNTFVFDENIITETILKFNGKFQQNMHTICSSIFYFYNKIVFAEYIIATYLLHNKLGGQIYDECR